MTSRPAFRQQHGFTLIEAVMVITIIGILGAVVAVFIRAPIQGYVDSRDRAELSDTADLALRRIARDLRLALPNSVRVNAAKTAIEFIPTKAGGRYLAAEDGVASLPVLDFADPSKWDVAIVGAFPAGKSAIDLSRDYFVVYNLGPGFAPADAYGLNTTDRNIVPMASTVAAANRLTLLSNPFASQSTPMPSPSARFQIVTQPVSYVCATGASGNLVLSRQWNYGFATGQSDAPVAPSADTASLSGAQYRMIAGRVASCRFDYLSLATRRSALVIITLELQPRNSTDATVRMVQQVHVDNTP